jgi:hypothetical protein
LRFAVFAVFDAAKTQARPDRHGPSGPREIDAGWMGAHAPITNLDSCWGQNPLMRRQLTLKWRRCVDVSECTIPDGQIGRTYLGRGPYAAGSKPGDNLLDPGKKSLSA